MIDKEKICKLVNMYQNYYTTYKGKNGESYWEEEEFKWRGVKIFQDNWNVEAPDFAGMMKRSLSGVSNLMVSQAYFPEAMIEGFAEREPETVRAMFKNLFDESKDIVERFRAFKQKSDDLLERVGYGAKNHFQDERTIAIYIWLKYPEKYYIYRFSQARNLSNFLGSDHKIIKGHTEDNIRECLALYNEVTELIKQEPELLAWETKNLTPEHYSDPACHLLTADMAYCYTERRKQLKNGSQKIIVPASLPMNGYSCFQTQPYTPMQQSLSSMAWSALVGKQPARNLPSNTVERHSLISHLPLNSQNGWSQRPAVLCQNGRTRQPGSGQYCFKARRQIKTEMAFISGNFVLSLLRHITW